MVFRTRLVNFILNCSKSTDLLSNRSQLSLDKFTRVLSLLLIGFLIGNLFGTFLNTIRKHIMWDGAVILFLISIIEISNYNVYHYKNRSFLSVRLKKKEKVRFSLDTDQRGLSRVRPKVSKQLFWKSFNFFKIGLMVGFFVDAFKVGS